MPKSRIVVIGPVPPPYHGVTVSTQRVLESDLQKTFDIIHFDISDHRDLNNIGKIDYENVVSSLWNVARLAWVCLRKRPDVVYLTVNRNIAYARDGLFILAAKLMGRSKVIIHLHGAHFREAYDTFIPPARWFVDLTLRAADKAIVLGDCLRYNFSRWFAARDIHVIPNGTSFDPDRSLRTPSRDPGKVVVVYLGNLIEEKGVVDLVKAAPAVLREWPETEFLFAGLWWNTDDAKRKCEEEIAAHGLASRVRFVGVLTGKDKERFLLDADMLVFPTYYRGEGHPNVVLEAMAAGLPVIATDYVAIAETVVDGATGYLVPLRSPEAIAEKIVRLAKDPALRAELGRGGRRRYESHYTHERNIEIMTALFQEACGEPASGGRRSQS